MELPSNTTLRHRLKDTCVYEVKVVRGPRTNWFAVDQPQALDADPRYREVVEAIREVAAARPVESR
ncbi:MAG: hypothetical protein HY815_32095 [Candidatus Riflebacteria bacterium]|nr:hypothetical protein [Candidatus Riflebacteria bacterium]